jgi:DNA-binding transcriptional ArsR family regulator
MNQKRRHRLWKGHLKILKILLEKELSFSELRDETGFKDNTVFEYLQDLQDQGLVFKRPSDGKYTTYERGSQNFDSHLDKASQMTESIVGIPHSVRDFLQSTRSMTESKGIEEAVVRANIMLLTAWIPDLIYNCLLDQPDNVHRRMDELIDGVAKPWIHSLLELGLVYIDLAEKAAVETRDSVYELGLKERERYSQIMGGFS